MQYRKPGSYNLNNFRHRRLYRIPLDAYIERFCKSEWAGRVSGSDYKIYLARGCYLSTSLDENGGQKVAYRDGTHNFLLTIVSRVEGSRRTKRQEIACIGFYVEKGVVDVRQIQGVMGQQEALAPLRWEKMLLQIVVDWARENAFAAVWIRIIGNRRLRYRTTAKRLGFKFSDALDLRSQNLRTVGILTLA